MSVKQKPHSLSSPERGRKEKKQGKRGGCSSIKRGRDVRVGQELATICTEHICMTTFTLFPILDYSFVLPEILSLPKI